jgi:hypothetical protein
MEAAKNSSRAIYCEMKLRLPHTAQQRDREKLPRNGKGRWSNFGLEVEGSQWNILPGRFMLHSRVQCVNYRASRICASNEVHSVPYRRRVHRAVVRSKFTMAKALALLRSSLEHDLRGAGPGGSLSRIASPHMLRYAPMHVEQPRRTQCM